MINAALRYALGGLGFVLGIAIGFGIEFVLLAMAESATGRHYNPAGLGWVALPISLGLGLGRIGLAVDGAKLILKVIGGAAPLKAYAAACVFWFLGILGWLIITEPFRDQYRLRDDDWIFLGKLFLVPPIFLFVAFSVGAWAAVSAAKRP